MSKFSAPVSSGKELSGTDGAAQAGMIRLKVSQLGRLEEAVLIARFAPSYVLCDCGKSCCTGRKPNDEWTHAIAVLSQHMKENILFGCSTTIDMRVGYLNRFFLPKNQRMSIDEMAKRHGITKRTVVSHIAKVINFLIGSNEKRGLKDAVLRLFEDWFNTDNTIS